MFGNQVLYTVLKIVLPTNNLVLAAEVWAAARNVGGNHYDGLRMLSFHLIELLSLLTVGLQFVLLRAFLLQPHLLSFQTCGHYLG